MYNLYDRLIEEIYNIKQNITDNNIKQIAIIKNTILDILKHKSIRKFKASEHMLHIGEIVSRSKLLKTFTVIVTDIVKLYDTIQSLKFNNFDNDIQEIETNLSALEQEVLLTHPDIFFNENNRNYYIYDLKPSDAITVVNLVSINNEVLTNAELASSSDISNVEINFYTDNEKYVSRKIFSYGQILGLSYGDQTTYECTYNDLFNLKGIEYETYRTYNTYQEYAQTLNVDGIIPTDATMREHTSMQYITNISITTSKNMYAIDLTTNASFGSFESDDIDLLYNIKYENDSTWMLLYNINKTNINITLPIDTIYASENSIPFVMNKVTNKVVSLIDGNELDESSVIVYDLDNVINHTSDLTVYNGEQ